MADSTSTSPLLFTDSASQISTTTAPPITSSSSSIVSSNDHFRTVFVTITTSAGPQYSLNATEKMWGQQSNAIGQWSAIGVIGVYVLFAVCLLLGWMIRCIRRKPKIRPSSLPPEVTERGDGSFLATETVGIKKGRTRSRTTISAVSALETDTVSRYSFEGSGQEGQGGGAMVYEGPNYPAHGSLRSLQFEDQPYLSPISVSPTISNFPTSGSSHRVSSGIYSTGGRRYSSSQTNLIPLQTPPNQYQLYLGEAEAAEQARLGSGSRGRNRSSSQSTLRYYFAQSEDDYYEPELEPEPPVPPVPSMPVAAMVDGHHGNPYPQGSGSGRDGNSYPGYV